MVDKIEIKNEKIFGLEKFILRSIAWIIIIKNYKKLFW